jgi:hypothetical protein
MQTRRRKKKARHKAVPATEKGQTGDGGVALRSQKKPAQEETSRSITLEPRALTQQGTQIEG